MNDALSGPSWLDAAFRPLPADGDPGTLFLCSLCGCRFTHGGQVCGACPMSTGCDLVKCPHCGFQFPRSSHIANGISRLWKRLTRRLSE